MTLIEYTIPWKEWVAFILQHISITMWYRDTHFNFTENKTSFECNLINLIIIHDEKHETIN
jgi:hypothetical protein